MKLHHQFHLAVIAFASVALASCTSMRSIDRPASGGVSLRFIGEQTLPHRMEAQGQTFGGISGIDYDEARNVFYLLSDDRSQNGPARFYTARMSITANDLGKPEILSVTTIKRPDGALHGDAKTDPQNVLDPESIRLRRGISLSGVVEDVLLWTSEGDKRLGLSPFVREMRLDGTFIRELPTHPMFAMRSGQSGSRDNLSFEGMALAPDGKSVWVAMEGALYEDGATASIDGGGGPIRFTQYDVSTGKAMRQVAYALDAIPHRPIPPTGFADNGVPEILMLDEHRMLVLERSFSQGVGNSIRIYVIDVRDGSDTLSVPNLNATNHRAARKTLVINFDTLNLMRLDNTEAMSFGPRLPNGNRTLLVASDDNFNARQINQFLAFEILAK